MYGKTLAALSLCAALLCGGAAAPAQDCAPPDIVAHANSNNTFTPPKANLRIAGALAFVRFNLADDRLLLLSDAQRAYAFDLTDTEQASTSAYSDCFRNNYSLTPACHPPDRPARRAGASRTKRPVR